jgi:hypothetical protein
VPFAKDDFSFLVYFSKALRACIPCCAPRSGCIFCTIFAQITSKLFLQNLRHTHASACMVCVAASECRVATSMRMSGLHADILPATDSGSDSVSDGLAALAAAFNKTSAPTGSAEAPNQDNWKKHHSDPDVEVLDDKSSTSSPLTR